MKEFGGKHIYDEVSKIREGLLIKFYYSKTENTFELVGEKVDFNLQSGHRAFLKFIFKNVHSYSRQIGLFEASEDAYFDFRADRFPISIVLQEIAFTPSENFNKLNLWFGESFGGVDISFEAAMVFEKVAYAIQTGEQEWMYRDLDHDELVDIYNPFASKDF
ncbi:MAG: hypothetical protein AAFV80_17775 [Bacteroidota bacterium]